MNFSKSEKDRLISFCELITNVSTGLGLFIVAVPPITVSRIIAYGMPLGLLFAAVITKYYLERLDSTTTSETITYGISKNALSNKTLKKKIIYFIISGLIGLVVYFSVSKIYSVLDPVFKYDVHRSINSINELIKVFNDVSDMLIKLDNSKSVTLLISVAAITAFLFSFVFITLKTFPKSIIDYIFVISAIIALIAVVITPLGIIIYLGIWGIWLAIVFLVLAGILLKFIIKSCISYINNKK